MEPAKNVQQQTTTTRLTRTCTRAVVTLSSYPGSPGPGLCTTPFILRATQKQRCCHDGGCAPEDDTDCLQPLKQTHGCSLWSSGNCMYTGSTTQKPWHETVLRGLRRGQSEPLLPLLFLRSSHSDDWLPQLFGSVQYFFVSTKSLSCFCRR